MSVDLRALLGGQAPEGVQEASPEEQRLRDAILHLIRVLLQIPELRALLLQELQQNRMGMMSRPGATSVGPEEEPPQAMSFLERLRQLRGEEV